MFTEELRAPIYLVPKLVGGLRASAKRQINGERVCVLLKYV